MKTTCPNCGHDERETLAGTFMMNVPPNIPGGAIEIKDATWEHCHHCGTDIIPDELSKSIQAERNKRLDLHKSERKNMGKG